LHIAPPSVWLCVIALAGRYPSVACVHLAPLRAGVAWVACLAGLARVRARVRAYSRFRKNLARKLSHRSYKSAFTGSQRPICKSGATVGVRGF